MFPDLLLAIPGISLDNADPGDVSTTLQLLLMLTVLSLAPGILIMMTSFTRIIIVLSFVRTGLGTQSMPPNQVLIGLALFLTFFIMSPIAIEMNDTALQPYLDEELTQEEALDAAILPLKEFMAQHTREKDLALFFKYAGLEKPDSIEGIPLTSLIPAFALSELKTAFQIGFIIFIPFLIIDMVVGQHAYGNGDDDVAAGHDFTAF